MGTRTNQSQFAAATVARCGGNEPPTQSADRPACPPSHGGPAAGPGHFDRSTVVKCSCSRPYSDAAWSALEPVGDLDSGVPGVVLALANCVCGSTLARPRCGDRYLTDAEYAELEARADIIAERDRQDAELDHDPRRMISEVWR